LRHKARSWVEDFQNFRAQWWVANASRRRGSLDEMLGNRVAFYERARHIIANLKADDEDSRHHCIADLSESLKGVSEAVYADTGSQNRPIPSL
jgi:hypothetical protein